MDSKKLIKFASLALSVAGMIISIMQKQIDDKEMEFLIAKEVEKQLKSKIEEP